MATASMTKPTVESLQGLHQLNSSGKLATLRIMDDGKSAIVFTLPGGGEICLDVQSVKQYTEHREAGLVQPKSSTEKRDQYRNLGKLEYEIITAPSLDDM